MSIATVIIPIMRELICAIGATWFNSSQAAVFFFMITTELQLGFMVSGRRFESNNLLKCFDMLVQLYLSYLLLILTNFLVDE